MMEIQTKQFGTLQVDEGDVYQFSIPMFGLEEYTQFVLIRPDESLPFAYLQSTQDPYISLLLADPFVFHSSYEFDLPEKELELLHNPTPDDLAVWVTVTLKDTLQNSMMNLLAPLVFNHKQKRGLQVVLHNSGYATKVPLKPVTEEAK